MIQMDKPTAGTITPPFLVPPGIDDDEEDAVISSCDSRTESFWLEDGDEIKLGIVAVVVVVVGEGGVIVAGDVVGRPLMVLGVSDNDDESIRHSSASASTVQIGTNVSYAKEVAKVAASGQS
jgi:hypothetical protein